MKGDEIHRAMAVLAEVVQQWQTPAVTIIANDRSPFKVLVSCILSLRTRDETTAAASKRLFRLADNPKDLAALEVTTIEEAIFPVGFYRNKAAQLQQIAKELVENYGGKVPDEIDELLKFKGVGRKTANLVVTLGYDKPGICVDIHVHRICNRWGYVSTATPAATETALREKLPREYWIPINDLLVTFGQNQCLPVTPRCSTCPLAPWCDRVGVKKFR
ncbi:endonuclease III domain-containing protein [Geomesophilobacter sediminis]|uniref:Endonuclease III n=1 Tax=Geomesophilobacter sediminis TaxID=2798584 RepID=A0A8J7M2Q0_9BACT|nr:endonuclease III [Geomesophilobacter sediminis]MBJ6727543.1 endonuclease III [Geomesophilobacter sediminis]